MSKKWTKILKLAFVITLFVIILNMSSNVYAAINKEYYEKNIDATKVVETDTSLDKKVKSSILLDALGNLSYVIGSVMEFLIGKLFSAISANAGGGYDIFPWTDMILFNAIPILDVNFINPDPGSITAQLQEVVKSVYGTVFGLAISFFSIAVLVMGIKIAISTIASEKAKYKQAIGEWLMALVMLFVIHIFISFVFYLNEQLVTEASKIASNALNEANIVIEEANTISAEDLCYNFISAMRTPSIVKTVLTGLGIAATVIALAVVSGGTTIPVALALAISFAGAVSVDVAIGEIVEAVEANLANNPKKAEEIIMENVDLTAYLLNDEEYVKNRLGSNLWDGEKDWDSWAGDRDATAITRLAANVALLTDTTIADGNTKANNVLYMEALDKYISEYNNADAEYRSNNKETYNIQVALRDAGTLYVNNTGTQNPRSLISNLAQYFKKTSWSYGENSWKASKVVIQNALMYAILVVQSLIFLIAYVKRLFYVILLAIMAPAVVVYDFFNKAIS